MAQMGFFDADKRLAALTLAALEHAELPGDAYGPRLLQPFLAILQTLVDFPVHAFRLGWEQIVETALAAEALADFQRSRRGPGKGRFVLCFVFQVVAAPTAEKGAPIDNAASRIAGWALEPLAMAAEIRYRLDDRNEVGNVAPLLAV